ncbi:MAG: FmdB family zinc ribbon protein [Thermoanaerobaculia bacterium]
MPLYEYKCQSCGKTSEVLQRLDEAPITACPLCGGEVKKLISSPAVQFKGSGWYVTDYGGKKGAGSSSESKSEKSEKSESKSEPKAEKAEKAESKADSKPAAAESKGSSGGGGGTE